MKAKIALILLAGLLAGCTTKTEYGNCIGVNDDKDPSLNYKVSVQNVAMGVIFSETIVVPIVVLADQTFCPVSAKKK